jgi:SAM-dependent methyltransferase
LPASRNFWRATSVYTDMPQAESRHHLVCPWWLGYFLIIPLRRWLSNPAQILGPHVREGMTVLEPGPGMGFFTLELARLVGPRGRVLAVDLQPKMLDKLKRRAQDAGLDGRIDARLAAPDSLNLGNLAPPADFALAFAVVHEMPSPHRFFFELRAAMKPGARLLLAEPAGHVSDADFQAELKAAGQAGFLVVDRPVIRRSQVALLEAAVTS